MLNLFIDMTSQPSRAVLTFVKINSAKIGPWKSNPLNLAKGHQNTPEMLKINPDAKVPFMQDSDGFNLAESHAMMKYLCYSRNLPEHWYPRNIENLKL